MLPAKPIWPDIRKRDVQVGLIMMAMASLIWFVEVNMAAIGSTEIMVMALSPM
jgi:hypothetical protein